MSAASERNRDAVIEAARVSLVRIALAFGLLNAVVPLFVIVGSGDREEIVLGALWVAGWVAAVLNAERLLRLIEQPLSRTAGLLLVGLATVATVALTGGINSPLKTGGNWLGWAATVALSKRASMAVASVFSLALVTAFLVSGTPANELFDDANRYVVVTGILNPSVIVFVALALAGVFRWLIGVAPGTLWSIRNGGEATTDGLAQLFRNPPIPLLKAGGPDGSPDARKRAVLTQEERELISDLANGRTPQQIALQRGWTQPMAYRRLATARSKVGARTNEQLVALAWEPN